MDHKRFFFQCDQYIKYSVSLQITFHHIFDHEDYMIFWF